MKEIQDIVNAKIAEMSESGEIQKKIEDGVKASVEKAISKQFENYGAVTEQLDKIFKESICVDKHSLDIPRFTAVMEGVINQQINEFFKGEAAERFRKLINEKLKPLPQEMPVGDFIEMVCKEWFVSDYDDRDDVDDYASIEFEKSEYDWFDLKMWKQKSSRRADVHLCIDKDGTILGNHAKDHYYVFNHDALIFKAYSQNVKLTGLDDFDPDDFDTSLKSDDY